MRVSKVARQPLRALSSNSSSANTNNNIQQFYEKYVDVFVSGDMKTVSTEYYKAPVSVSMCVHGHTIMRSTFNTAVDVEQALTFQMEGLLARGYAGKSDMNPISVTPMTDIAKLIQTEGTRYHTSGAVLEKIRASYVIERFEDDPELSGDTAGPAPAAPAEEGAEAAGRGRGRWFITAIHGEITPVMEN
jgi:hypothetical protein